MSQRTVAPAPSTEVASSASTSYPCYDVFINHRGPDCKHTFATRLYRRLREQGLQVFLDDKELIEGHNITSQLEAAIRGASLQVAIFSPTYAKSEWCLNELVWMVNSGATILPVFYDVEPSVLRWTVGVGVYGEALQNLQRKTTYDPQNGEEKLRYDSNTIQSWRTALSHVAGISGFVLHGDESELLEKVVQGVMKKVSKTPLDVAKYPTGLSEKLQDFERTVVSKLHELKTVGAKIAGIVGVGGVGKTTLAKHFFNLKRSDYDASSFLFDVRENARTRSLHYVQSKLIEELKHIDIKIESRHQGIGELKKHLSSCHALIILDDIDNIDQMEALLPMKDILNPGSLILVTSRDKHVLRSSGVLDSSIYNLKGLNRPDSEELLCSYAFYQRHPLPGFADLVDRFVTACDGLPLSLKVFGALVCQRKQAYWKEVLERLHDRLPAEIQDSLRISYESLEKEDQKILLDIACFFIGEEIDTAIRIWGIVGLENLESRCLIEVNSENKIKMHDHIRDMGRIIASQGSMPRRLSHIDDFLEQTSTGITEVRGISMVPHVPRFLLFESPSHLKDPKWKLFNKDRYDCMNLKILATEGDYLEAILSGVPSAPLIWLRWYHCPHSSLPSWIPMENLRVLEVGGSRLEMLWQLESQAPLQLRELNIFSPLSHCPKSIGQLKHLEKIVVGIKGQTLPLKTLPEEFGHLHSLRCLTLRGFSELVSLPESFGKLSSLQRINLIRPSSLKMLPNSFGNLTSLQLFSLYGASSLKTLPDSFGNLKNLQHINWTGASSLKMLPNSFGNLANLQHLILSGSSSLNTLPNSFGNLTNLRQFTLSRDSKLETLPNSFGNLTNLRHIDWEHASRLETVPDSFGNLTNLQYFRLSGAYSLKTLPNSFVCLKSLKSLELAFCPELNCLPNSFESSIQFADLSLPFCGIEDSEDSPKMQGLKSWNMPIEKVERERETIKVGGALNKLDSKDNCMSGLERLLLYTVNISGVAFHEGICPNLQHLTLWRCKELRQIGQLCGLAELQYLEIMRCANLEELPTLEKLISLKKLMVSECPKVKSIHGLAQLTMLRGLIVAYCHELRELQGLEHVKSLERLPVSEYPVDQSLKETRFRKLLRLGVRGMPQEGLVIHECPKLQLDDYAVLEQPCQLMKQRPLIQQKRKREGESDAGASTHSPKNQRE